MKILSFSDLHGYLPEITTSNIDLVCICGDIVPLKYQNCSLSSMKWFDSFFIPWVRKIIKENDCKKVIFIAGRHDFWLQVVTFQSFKYLIYSFYPDLESKLIYLLDNKYKFNNIKIYGTPYVKFHGRWAFDILDDAVRGALFDKIPDNCDILLTHTTPVGRFFDPILFETLKRKNVRYNFHGHYHDGNHNLYEYKENSYTVNVSLLNDFYKVTYNPFVITI